MSFSIIYIHIIFKIINVFSLLKVFKFCLLFLKYFIGIYVHVKRVWTFRY